MAHFFRQSPLPDTLRILVHIQGEASAKVDSIPNALFFSKIPTMLLQEIDYLADSSQAAVFGHLQFPLTDNVTAYWVEIKQFWFQHHSLFLYDHAQKAYTDRITVAEFYGGDGGQTLIGSWLFDYDGDGDKDILQREVRHSIIPQEEDMVERTEQAAALLLWRDGHFEAAPLTDSEAVIKRFPISGL